MHVGVLALQGAVREHLAAVGKLGHVPIAVRTRDELSQVEALILPGGESTAMRKLIDQGDLLASLQEFCQHKPVLGTCAGAILLAKQIVGENKCHIGTLNVKIQRNAYGSQLDSFMCTGQVAKITDFPFVFIRAPLFVDIGAQVEIIAQHKGQVVGVRQGRVWALSFHPELTNDLRVHEQFLAQE